MAKLISYDNTGVETSSGGTGVKAKPGVYVAKIERCTHRDTNKAGGPVNDLEVILNVGDEYDWIYTYVSLGVDWKVAEFTRALELPDKGKLDPDKVIGKILRVKVNPGSYGNEYSPDAGRLMKPLKGDKEPGRVSAISGSGDDPTEAEPEDEAGEETSVGQYENPDFKPYREGQPDPENPEEAVGSYDEWSDADLEAEVGDRGLTLPGGRASKKNKMIAALRAEDEEVGGGAEPEAEAEGEADDAQPEDDYDDWDLGRLQTEWEARSLGDIPKFRGANAGDRVKQAIIDGICQDDIDNPFEP